MLPHTGVRVRLSAGLLLAADGEPLTALGAAALQNDPAVLGGHPNAEPVRLPATAGVWLKRALPLHDLSGVRHVRTQPAREHVDERRLLGLRL